MRLPTSILTLTCLLFQFQTIVAIYADEAYELDYAHTLLGVPRAATTFFHRPRKDDRASLLYTLSDLGVLGAVNPGNGEIVWRQLLVGSVGATNPTSLVGNTGYEHGHVRGSEGAVTSAMAGNVQSWDATTGRERWSNQFGSNARDLEVIESVGSTTDGDVLVLFEETGGSGVLRRLDGKTGDVIWEHACDSGDVPLQVSTNVQSVFVVTLHGAWGGYNVKVTTLDPLTGRRVDEHTLSSQSDVHMAEDVLFVGANSAAPFVAWVDKTMKNLKVNILGTNSVHTLPLSEHEEVEKVVVHAPRSIQSQSHFLVHVASKTKNWAEVYHVDIKKGTVSGAFHLPILPGKGAFSTSEIDANVYFTRNTVDEVIVVGSSSHAVLARWPTQERIGKGSVAHGVSEVVRKSETSYAVRSAVVTSVDDWVMIRNGSPDWTRPESMSGATAAIFYDIPKDQEYAETLKAEADRNPATAYINRVERHIMELQYLPAWLAGLPQKIVASVMPVEPASTSTGLDKNSFGFRKLVIVATRRGRVYALDTGDQGSIVWSQQVFDVPATGHVDIVGIFNLDGQDIVTIKAGDGAEVVIRPADGNIVKAVPAESSNPILAAGVVDTTSGKRIMTTPTDDKHEIISGNLAPTGTIVVQSADGNVQGQQWKATGDDASPVTTWIFRPAAGHRVLSITGPASSTTVASIGRALGDRTVLYKYLNPNMVFITTVSDSTSTATFVLLDTVSGEVLHTTTHSSVDTRQPIASLLSENWFVYSLYSEIAVDPSIPYAKGYQLVASELYESSLANDRGSLDYSSNSSALMPPATSYEEPTLPHVKTIAFLTPSAINSMSVSQTLQGITSRALLLTLAASNAIISLPLTILDPRRPAGRAATASEKEEGLSDYQPWIEFDPKFYITHKREVMGIKKVITSPSLLESTSLVFAYGVDIFGTRLMPSGAFDVLGAGFNKVTLIATVLALVTGVGALAPMVRRKQINGRWKTA